MVSDGDLARTVQAVGTLAEQVETLVNHTATLAELVRKLQEQLNTLEERFREHGHVGEGLGSCWDGS
jgi:chaperonin cofactor prefoldin